LEALVEKVADFFSGHTEVKINILDNDGLLLDHSLLGFLDAFLVFLYNRI
jgi:hypothetical protein